MKVLLASSEAVPFAKVGGLADVVGSLPAALREQGIEARVIIPGYGFIDHLEYKIKQLLSFEFYHRQGMNEVTLYTCEYDSIPFYLLQSPPYFGLEGEVYTDWNWDMERFVYLNQALMAALLQLKKHVSWFPDVLHVNDWHTSLLPFLIRAQNDSQPWSSLATVISIHNIAYQGNHAGGFLFQAGIDGRQQADLVYYDLTDNMLGIGIAYSDKISTVSPRYAEEIKYTYAGYELAPLIGKRESDLRGILNGLDTKVWDPATDPRLFENFNIDNHETENVRSTSAICNHLPDCPLSPIHLWWVW